MFSDNKDRLFCFSDGTSSCCELQPLTHFHHPISSSDHFPKNQTLHYLSPFCSIYPLCRSHVLSSSSPLTWTIEGCPLNHGSVKWLWSPVWGWKRGKWVRPFLDHHYLFYPSFILPFPLSFLLHLYLSPNHLLTLWLTLTVISSLSHRNRSREGRVQGNYNIHTSTTHGERETCIKVKVVVDIQMVVIDPFSLLTIVTLMNSALERRLERNSTKRTIRCASSHTSSNNSCRLVFSLC